MTYKSEMNLETMREIQNAEKKRAVSFTFEIHGKANTKTKTFEQRVAEYQ